MITRNTIFNHDCADCKLKRKVIVPEVNYEDVREYEEIYTALSTAQMAKNPGIIFENVTKEDMEVYLNVVLDREARYKQREIEWWRRMIEKYHISQSTKIDVINKQFYACVDENGKEYIEFDPIKKPNNIDAENIVNINDSKEQQVGV